MNSIILHLENDGDFIQHQEVDLTFSRDGDGNIVLRVSCQSSNKINDETELYISKKTLQELPKMLEIISDFIKNED
jgi:hypothetical protein